MFGSVTSTLRFIIGAVLLLNVLHRYETFRITRSPDKTTVVIEGENSTNVALYWMFSLKVNESIRSVAFNRRRFGESDTRIAIKRGNQPFTYDSDEIKANYVARSSPISATLVLVNVINSEEYIYTLRLTYADGNGRILSRPTSSTSVVVYVPPNITLNPFRKAYVEVGQNYTLTCKASGDPLPVITWTRDGVPRNQFNVSGYELHLANVHTKDVGSYRCTAHNGYGEDSSTVGIIGLNCDAGSQCRSEKVNITLSSETWNENLSNNESSEFKALEKELLSEILEVYARNYGKQLYRLTVEKFSPGSVVATMRFSFGLSACEPLKPLQDEIAGAKLGQFTVDRQLYVFPQILIPATTPSTTNATTQTKTPARVNADPDNKEQTLMLHAIYLAAIGFLVLVNIILMILLWRRRKSSGSAKEKGCRCRNRENNNQLKDVQGERPAVEGCAADTISDNTELASLPSLLPSDPSLDGAQQSIYDACEVVTTSKKNWESGREYVNLVKDIGKGAFCKVAKAEAWNINGIKGLTTVAVKMLKENASESDRKDLLSELELMKNLRPHPHVIKLMGCVTKSDPLLVLIEYIPYGDLLGFLRKSRGLNDTYYKDPDVKPRTNLTSRQMMQFAWQIADGMSYLSSKKIIHRDLAARNVLVGEGEMCKVTDFGMARNVQQDDIYTKRSRGRLPVKWTAYEALLYGKYTTQSDVWSFGVVLYEIFTVGGCPYPGINGREIANRLKSGYRMPKPKHVDRQLYQTMLQCWQQNPNDRPTFFALKNKLTSMVENNEEIYINMQEYDTKDYGYIDDLLE